MKKILLFSAIAFSLNTNFASASCESGKAKAMARNAAYRFAADQYDQTITAVRKSCRASAFDMYDLPSGDEMHLVSLKCKGFHRVLYYRVTLSEYENAVCFVKSVRKVKH